MKKLNFDEALFLWDDFMENSGIRKYCQEKCKGECCTYVPWCGKNCKESLPCVSYICSSLLINISEKLYRAYEKFTDEIIRAYNHDLKWGYGSEGLENHKKSFQNPADLFEKLKSSIKKKGLGKIWTPDKMYIN